MTPLELKRIKLELKNVEAARLNLEFRIEESLDQIERIKENVKIQETKEVELAQKIKDAEANQAK